MNINEISTDQLHAFIGILKMVEHPNSTQKRLISVFELQLGMQELFNIKEIDDEGKLLYYTSEEYMNYILKPDDK